MRILLGRFEDLNELGCGDGMIAARIAVPIRKGAIDDGTSYQPSRVAKKGKNKVRESSEIPQDDVDVKEEVFGSNVHEAISIVDAPTVILKKKTVPKKEKS